MIAPTESPVAARASDVDIFVDDAVCAYQRRLAAARAERDRAIAEAALTLLTDYRMCGIDAAGFDALLARMARGRSPVTLLRATPSSVAADIAAHWRAHRAAPFTNRD